jgi:chromosome segregation ATPase
MVPPVPDDATLAVVVARLDDLRGQQRADTKALTEAIEGLRSELAASRLTLVSRGEWDQRNAAVADRFQEHGREIGTLRTSLETKATGLKGEITALEAKIDARRAPWWAVASVAVGMAGVVVAVAALLAR